MAAVQEAQQEAMATIDAAKVLVDKVLSILQLVSLSPSLSLNFATNPIGFLMQLLEHLGVTYEELRDWLSNFLIYILPMLEVSIKAILLTNLKSMVTCTADPRIPDKYRKQHKAITSYNTSQEYGIDISLETIDFFNKLTVNPLSDEGKDWYFGLDGVKDVYKFARAEDFDAFLWFIMHKGKFPNSSKISGVTEFSSSTGSFKAESYVGDSLLETVTVNFGDSNPSRILPGNTFTYTSDAQIISLCIESLYGKDNKITKNTLVPVSDDWNSVNWYTRRGDYLTSNLGIGKKESRDYNKECGICNIQFLDQASTQDSPLTGLVNNKFRFTILPKPYVHTPSLGEPIWRFKKLLFNSKGEYDPNGKYTISTGVTEEVKYVYVYNGIEYTTSEDARNAVKNDYPRKSEQSTEDYETEIDEYVKKYVYTECTNIIIKIDSSEILKIDCKSGNVVINNKSKLIKNLIECYPGLTVFEFNYDYVMGMKLFDAKVIATTLLDSLKNMRLGVGATIGMQHQDGTDEIVEIIKNIIESDDISVNDCFFEFSNDKYDALLRNAEERNARKKDVSSVKDILNEYNDEVSLHEQIDVLNRAFTQASEIVTDGLEEQDKFKVRFDFVTDLIEQLTLALVKAIFSPKVLMLFEVNETIMGGKWQKLNFKDLIKAMRTIIVAIIKEVRDLIIQELLKMLMKILSPIIAVLTASIVREQIEAYTEVIDDIIRNCPRIWFSMGNQYSDTKLDTVDYADIDTSVTKGGESPQLNNC